VLAVMQQVGGAVEAAGAGVFQPWHIFTYRPALAFTTASIRSPMHEDMISQA
jgi:hypothetical protein